MIGRSGKGRIASLGQVIFGLGVRCARRAVAAATSLLILGLLLSLGARPASAQCPASSSTQNNWIGSNGNWSDNSDWSTGTANGFNGANNSISVCIAQPTATTVTLDINPSAANLTIGTTDTLDIAPGFTLTLNGSQISNSGNIDLNGSSGSPANLVLNNSATLSDGGTVTLAYSSTGPLAYISDGGTVNDTLTNDNNTIQGIGEIEASHLALDNESGGTIDANVSQGSEVLSINGFGAAAGVTNSGLMEATNGGTLVINDVSPDVINAGGNITADGGTVELTNETIQGGALNQKNGGTLEAAALENGSPFLDLDGSNATYGAVTITGTYTDEAGVTTNLLGTINNDGTMNFDSSTGNDAILGVAANATLQGGGTVTLSGPQAGIEPTGTPDLYTLTNFNNTIQGAGTISVAHLVEFDNEAAGTVDANVAGKTLLVDGFGGNGSVVNAGLMEATNGGTLTFQDTAASINNANGTIEAGASSTVALIGKSSTITGGIVDGTGTIDVTGGTGGAFTLSDGTITPGYSATNTAGTLSITGDFTESDGGAFDEIIGASGNGLLDVSGDVTLDGVLDIDVNGATLTAGEMFDILNYKGTLDGAFSNAALDQEFTADGWTWEITNYDDTSEDPGVDLEAVSAVSTGPAGVPEPSELPMLAIGLIALGAFYLKSKRAKAAR